MFSTFQHGRWKGAGSGKTIRCNYTRLDKGGALDRAEISIPCYCRRRRRRRRLSFEFRYLEDVAQVLHSSLVENNYSWRFYSVQLALQNTLENKGHG